MLRIRGDRTGSEQPHWLKPDDVCLHMTMSYALMDNNIDSGLKMVLKIYRPGTASSMRGQTLSLVDSSWLISGTACREGGACAACTNFATSRRRC